MNLLISFGFVDISPVSAAFLIAAVASLIAIAHADRSIRAKPPWE